VRKFNPIELASSDKKSRFVILDGTVKGDVQGVDTVCCTIFMMTDLALNVPGTSLESLQERIWESLTFHWTY
jgi:hypothetical protein